MNLNVSNSGENVSDLILKLCNHIGKNNPGIIPNLYKIAFTCISAHSTEGSKSSCDESIILQEMNKIVSENNPEDAEKLELTYINLCKLNSLKNRSSILSFLLNLVNNEKETPKWTLVKELEKLSATASKSQTVINSRSQESIRNLYDREGKHSNFSSQQSSTTRIMSSGATTISSHNWSKDYIPASSKILSINPVTENELLQDVIYSLQGIESPYIRKEIGGIGFVLDYKSGKYLTPIQRGLVERLLGTSFLHCQLKRYCDENDKQSGIVSQALTSTLREELSGYYKTIALLQANMKDSEMTLRRAIFVIHDHHTRFEWLAYIAEQCADKKGGALITAIHGFLQHGSKCAQEVSEKVLAAVCKPLYIMLSRWLLDGEINDPCNEFFIEAKTITSTERLWHDKYAVRETMVPSFITMPQARKIMATGKSINFLRQICRDGGQLPGRDSLLKLFKNTSAEALFSPEQNIEFHTTLESVYRETSLRVLDLLKNKFRLFEHLQSLRRYLLLGQGDFIRHLLELLVPELNKPARDIYGHNLHSILETAVRVTNAQYEDEDTLKRLNINFSSSSHNDDGWNVFSLCYIVDGPVGTIFQPTMHSYRSLFGALWRAKRMEFVLVNMRKQQLSMGKLFKNIKELKPVMHLVHILTGEMVHFLHQTQYYFLFEVLECSWAEMINQVHKAESLDDIIVAHRAFLDSVLTGVLLNEESRDIFKLLNIIYTFILSLESHQLAIYSATEKSDIAYNEYKKKRENPSGFGISREDELEERHRRENFDTFLKKIQSEIKCLTEGYDKNVRQYLRLLAANPNVNLQLLSSRLSFNGHYDPREENGLIA